MSRAFESGISLLPCTRRTWSPKGTTPILRHKCSWNWKRASMAAALGYHASDGGRGGDGGRGPRLCVHVPKDSYDTQSIMMVVLTQVGAFYTGQRVVLLWDGLGAHWSHAMADWVGTQDAWLTVERLPADAPELNSTRWRACGPTSRPSSWPTSP